MKATRRPKNYPNRLGAGRTVPVHSCTGLGEATVSYKFYLASASVYARIFLFVIGRISYRRF